MFVPGNTINMTKRWLMDTSQSAILRSATSTKRATLQGNRSGGHPRAKKLKIPRPGEVSSGLAMILINALIELWD